MDGRILIGVDEAGYGPNIGPLVIGATVWQITTTLSSAKVREALLPTFAEKTFRIGDPHVPIGDSKKLYSPDSGLLALEAGVLSMLAQCTSNAGDLTSLLKYLCDEKKLDGLLQWPWYQTLVQSLPELPQTEIERLSEIARTHLESREIKLLRIAADIVCESEFNAHVSKSGSKGQLLSTSSVKLAVDAASGYEGCAVEFFFDRQGGRKKYLPVLLEIMPEQWFDTIVESEALSSYRTVAEPRWTLHFTVGGDRYPPVGLASMTAKYLRERLMNSLNAYWRKQIPDIRPTAGYPQDAKRFRLDIESTARSLEFAQNTWWRSC